MLGGHCPWAGEGMTGSGGEAPENCLTTPFLHKENSLLSIEIGPLQIEKLCKMKEQQ